MSRRFLVLLAGSLVVLGVVGYAWYRSGSNASDSNHVASSPTTTATPNTSEPTDGVPKRLAWARQFNERQAAGKAPSLPAGEAASETHTPAAERERIPGASVQESAAAPTSPARTPLAERVKPPKSEDPSARQIGNQNLTRAEKQALVDKALVEHRLKPKPSPDRVPGASMARTTFVQQQCTAPDIQERYKALSAPEKARLRQTCAPYGVRFPI